jgi:hypothetical protein
MVEHGTTESLPTRPRRRVHRLHLSVAGAQLPERANRQKLAVDPQRVELNIRVGERVRVERMTILYRNL